MTTPPKPAVRHVYVIGPEEGLQKVGLATNPRARLAQLQTASPFDLILHTSVAVPFDLAPAIERKAHRLLIRSCVRNEWFETTPAEAIAAVQSAAAALVRVSQPAPRPHVWRLDRPLQTEWRAPGLPPLLRDLSNAQTKQPGAGPLFSYRRGGAEAELRVAASYQVTPSKLGSIDP